MASERQSTVPYLTPEARLYKYVRVPGGRWKYLRADHDIEGGYYVASDEGNWHRLDADPVEAWRLFRLRRVQGQVRELQAKARTLIFKRYDGSEAQGSDNSVRH